MVHILGAIKLKVAKNGPNFYFELQLFWVWDLTADKYAPQL